MTLASSFEAFEIDRLRAHFEFVVALLRAQPTAWLDDAGLATRKRTLALLESYAERGRFPRNETTSTRMLPSFVDSRGTECAVAHLMMTTGSGELAERVRATMNLAYVCEMVSVTGGEIVAWARGVGLTEAEAALVQPDYCSPRPQGACQYCSGGNPNTGTKGEIVWRDDGTTCGLGDEGANGQTGECDDGQCVAPPEPAAEGAVEEGGCFVAGVGFITGSMVPMLAALVVLAARRRNVRS